jgi:ribosomal protein S18 acetylase RimI-like enzyme
MQVIQRSYSGEVDKDTMAALVKDFPSGNLHVADLPYRLSSWAFDDPQNVALWVTEDGRLQAWAVMQMPFWTVDYAYHPQVVGHDLHQQILAWADQRARQLTGTGRRPDAHPAWFINVFPSQKARIHDLEATGFVCQADVGEDSWSKVWMVLGSQPVQVYHPPPGFVVRPLAGASEVEAYVELHRSVFETKNMTTEWRLRTLRHPDYAADLDLVVAAPDGRLAAFCIGWLNKHPASRFTGQIEPLGCHKDFRKYALGRVALSECLRRLQACGAQKIHVETDNYRNTAFALYRSMGFRVIRNVLVFRKDYEITF